MNIESKYDFDLDMVNTNSLSLIINQIKRGSKVLEFGPANGRMTRYLKEALECDVYLVEIDEEAGQQALQYAKDLLVDDIENYTWVSKYEDMRFDYITFADVLEHLRDPEKVLIQAKTLLKQDGSVLFSVPNLAHNSVVIPLLNHEFEYSKVGLLDNTHIHFFTKNSLENAMNRTGYHVAKRFATYAQVGSTEIATSYDAVPGIDQTFWRHREFGDVYQFVYEVKKGAEFIEQTENYLKSGVHPYFIQVYFDNGDSFSESYSRTYSIDSVFMEQEIKFDVTEDVRSIRIDPFNAPCVIDVIMITDRIDGEERPLRIMYHNGSHKDGNKFIFSEGDPWMVFGAAVGRQFHHVTVKFRFITVDAIKIAFMQEFFASVTREYEHKLRAMEHLEDQLETANRKLAEYEKVLENDEKIKTELNKQLVAHAASLQEVMSSTSWSVTKPLRGFLDFLHGRRRAR